MAAILSHLTSHRFNDGGLLAQSLPAVLIRCRTPGIAGTASSSAGHPDAGRLRHALRGPAASRDHQWGRQQDAATVQAMGFTRPRTPAVGSLIPYSVGWTRPPSRPPWPGGAGRDCQGSTHCGGRQSPAGDSRPRVARGAPGGRICSRIQPGGRATGELTTAATDRGTAAGGGNVITGDALYCGTIANSCWTLGVTIWSS